MTEEPIIKEEIKIEYDKILFTIEASILFEALEIVRKMNKEITLRLTPEGIIFRQFHHSRIGIVNVDLLKTAFEEFQLPDKMGQLDISFDVIKLLSLLKTVKGKIKITLTSSQIFFQTIEQRIEKKVIIRLLPAEFEERAVSLTPTVAFTLKEGDFKEIASFFETSDLLFNINVTQENITFENGDKHTLEDKKIVLKVEEVFDLTSASKEPITGAYPYRFIEKYIALKNELRVGLKPNAPLLLSGCLGDDEQNGTFKIFIAPHGMT